MNSLNVKSRSFGVSHHASAACATCALVLPHTIVLTPDTPRESFVEQHLRPAEAVRLRQEAVLCSVYDSNYLTGAQTVSGTSKTIEDQAIVVLRRLVRRT